MVIRRSSSADVQESIGELRASSTDEARREMALARLAVIGKRAVRRVLDALSAARTADEQIAFLLALERLPDERAVQPVLAILASPSNHAAHAPLAVRMTAVRAARPLLDLAPEGTTVLDRLTALILDTAENGELRCAALEALGDLPARAMKPLRRRLENDPDPAVRAQASSKGTPAPAVTSEGEPHQPLPKDPDGALGLVGRTGREAPLSTLHALLNVAREREVGRQQSDWQTVRGAIHLALAARESRVALYDLRESFEQVESHPLPADFLAAIRRLGDATCLEPLARAWIAASEPARGEPGKAWARDVRATFRELLERERPAARSRVVARLEKRWSTGEHASRLRDLLGPRAVTRGKGSS